MTVASPSFTAGAVLFDLDGTLVDSAPGITSAVNATLRGLGEPEVPVAELERAIGPPLHETFSRLLADRAPTADQIDAIVADYRARYAVGMVEGSIPYPGIRELLDALATAGRPLAVATAKSQPLAQALLEGLGLADRFAAICGPSPSARATKADTVRDALAALGLSGPDDPRGEAGLGASAVMIGDRLHDVEGAAANGLPAIGVLHGFGSRAELTEAGAAAIAVDVAELAALLGV